MTIKISEDKFFRETAARLIVHLATEGKDEETVIKVNPRFGVIGDGENSIWDLFNSDFDYSAERSVGDHIYRNYKEAVEFALENFKENL
jgi:hypothetical protein